MYSCVKTSPSGRVAEVADELLADLGRVGVGVAGAVELHHHDEVDVGVAPHLLGVRLQHARSGRRSSTRRDARWGSRRPARATATRARSRRPRASRRASYAASAIDGDDQRARRRPAAAASAARPRTRVARHMRGLCRTGTCTREHNDHNGDRGSHALAGCVAPGDHPARSLGGTMSDQSAKSAPRTRTAAQPHPLPLHRRRSSRSRSASPSASSPPTSPSSSSRSAQAFVALIKMMIQPVIFCTIVLGVGSVAQRRPGRQGRRPRARLLPDHVDGRARDRPASSATSSPGRRA